MPRTLCGRGERTRSLVWLVALFAVSMTWIVMSAEAARAALTPNQVAPTLTADGLTLRWNKVGTVTNYVLATKAPGKVTAYRTVSGTSFAPPAVTNTTVSYGLRTNVAGSAWAPEASINFTPAPVVSDKTAPTLRVDGQTLRWNQIANVTSYVLATKVPGAAVTYRTITGTSVTPSVVAGKTVAYGLRTNVASSSWAVEASIAYAGTTPPVVTPTPTPPPVVTPTPTPVPVTPPVTSKGLHFGLTAGGVDTISSAAASKRLGAKYVRMEFAIGSRPADMRNTIATYANNGISVIPLAGFHMRIATVAEAQNLGSWAREFGPGGTFWATRTDGHLAIQTIEFGNETSFSYQNTQHRGGEYALRFRDAYNAIHGSGGNPRMGLLAQADDGGSGSPEWVNAMFNAVPNLASLVSGWTVHPYGPQPRWQAKMDRLVSQTAARGASSSIPIDITEWGLATDNGRCLTDNYGWADKCMSYGSAASALSTTLTGMKARYGSRLRSFMLYQATDQQASGATNQREHYFGALKRDQSDKGAFSTEVRSQNARVAVPAGW